MTGWKCRKPQKEGKMDKIETEFKLTSDKTSNGVRWIKAENQLYRLDLLYDENKPEDHPVMELYSKDKKAPDLSTTRPDAHHPYSPRMSIGISEGSSIDIEKAEELCEIIPYCREIMEKAWEFAEQYYPGISSYDGPIADPDDWEFPLPGLPKAPK